jgi:maleate isomerase
VNATVRRYIKARGFEVRVFGSFNEEDDHKVARISPVSIREAAIELGRSREVDAVFVACTSLRVAAIAREIESELGKPVTSSNHAMAWHALRLANVDAALPAWGRLFELPLTQPRSS